MRSRGRSSTRGRSPLPSPSQSITWTPPRSGSRLRGVGEERGSTVGALAGFVGLAGVGFALGEVGLALLGSEAVSGGVAEGLLEVGDGEEPDSRGLISGRG